MKAEGNSPTGPWEETYDITPFKPKAISIIQQQASPGPDL